MARKRSMVVCALLAGTFAAANGAIAASYVPRVATTTAVEQSAGGDEVIKIAGREGRTMMKRSYRHRMMHDRMHRDSGREMRRSMSSVPMSGVRDRRITRGGNPASAGGSPRTSQ